MPLAKHDLRPGAPGHDARVRGLVGGLPAHLAQRRRGRRDVAAWDGHEVAGARAELLVRRGGVGLPAERPGRLVAREIGLEGLGQGGRARDDGALGRVGRVVRHDFREL